MKYKVLVEKDAEGWFVGEVVGLPGCHTQARSLENLRERMKEAIVAYTNDTPPTLETTFVDVWDLEA